MTQADIEIILQRAKELYPEARPRIISDNGPQFIAKDFKEFIRICGVTHVRTSPYYPQSRSGSPIWRKKIQTKDEVLAELMAEHVALKKEIGEL